jgi:3-oxoacyl-[acyl-carrier protein] reductase
MPRCFPDKANAIVITLNHKKIIVTGAASGIGKAITLQCLRLGARVLAVDIDGDGLYALSAASKNAGLRTLTADVSKHDEVKRVSETLGRNGDLPDGLVNNAGVYLAKSLLDYREEEVDRVLSVNIKSAVFLSQWFGKIKMDGRQEGVIVNITSVSGQEGSSDALYGLSKAALIGLTKSTAMNFAPWVRVNAIAPGIVDTPMMKVIPEYRLKAYREHELVPDPILPEDVAHTAAFLLSDVCIHYTGAVFDINNGCYLR